MRIGILRTTAYVLTLIVVGLVCAPYIVLGSGMIDRVSQVTTVVAFLTLSAAVLLEGRFRRPSSAHLAIGLFFLWQMMSVLWTGFLPASVYRTLVNCEFIIDIWLIWEISSTFGVRGIAQAYIIGACAGAINVVKNYVTGQAMFRSMDRYVSFGHDPNEEGIRLIIAVLLVFLITRGMSSKRLRVANYVVAALCCFAIFLTGSRTVMVAVSVPVVVLLMNTSGIRRVAVVAAVAVAIAIIPYVAPPESLNRMVAVSRNIESGEFSEREYIWQAVPRLFMMSPVVGHGANTFPIELSQLQGFQKTAHNVYMSVLVEEGAVGLLILCSVIAILVRCCLRLPKHERRLWLAMLATWGIGSLTMSIDFELITWVLFGLIIAAAHEPRSVPVRIWRRTIATSSDVATNPVGVEGILR